MTLRGCSRLQNALNIPTYYIIFAYIAVILGPSLCVSTATCAAESRACSPAILSVVTAARAQHVEVELPKSALVHVALLHNAPVAGTAGRRHFQRVSCSSPDHGHPRTPSTHSLFDFHFS